MVAKAARYAALPLLAIFIVIGLLAAPASAASTHRRNVALEAAQDQAQRGCWYNWAAAGPCGNGYDCSGLVVWAYAKVGIYLPHSTYSMLNDSAQMRPTSDPDPGNLAFFGDGHVTIIDSYGSHRVVHAPEPGERVQLAYWGGGWQPTAFYKVVNAGG